MNDLETYDPRLAQKLERRAIAKKDRTDSYELWIFDGYTIQINPCKTIEEARSMWNQAKFNQWERWELKQGETLIKRGVF